MIKYSLTSSILRWVKFWIDNFAPYSWNFLLMKLLVCFFSFKLYSADLGRLKFINISRTLRISSLNIPKWVVQMDFTARLPLVLLHKPWEMFFMKAMVSAFNNCDAGVHFPEAQLGQDLWLLVSVSTRVRVSSFSQKGWAATVENQFKEVFVSFAVKWTVTPKIQSSRISHFDFNLIIRISLDGKKCTTV